MIAWSDFFSMEWKVVSALLAGYGFLKEVRPSEPYITPFLTGPDKNFTQAEVNQEIFPVSTYSMVCLLVVIFLVTDFLRYKPIIVAQSLSAIVVYSIIAWAQGVPVMQFMEVLYGFMWSADVAYFTYMYAKVDRKHYGTVSATSRMGWLLGRFSSGVISQVTVSLGWLSLLHLQYITLAASSAATLFAVALPAVSTSFYFHKYEDVDAESNKQEGSATKYGATTAAGFDAPPAPGVEPKTSCLGVAHLLWKDCKDAYSQLYVVKWSLWWALATAGQSMILNYVQLLWQQTIEDAKSDDQLWNGATEAVYTLLGAGAVWLTTRHKDYSRSGDALIGLWSLGSGAIIIWAADSAAVNVQYLVYVVFGATYHAAITIANSEVAKRIRDDSHALVFGINMLASLVLQTLITVAVAGKGGLELDIRAQFVFYGFYFLVIGSAFLLYAMFTCLSAVSSSISSRRRR